MQSNWLELEGKTVVVTGGASGIGKAVSEEFLQNGANVVVCDMNPEPPHFNTNDNSSKVIYIVTDVTKKESVDDMVLEIIKTFGKIDVLVNNAGINIPRLLVDTKKSNSIYELDEDVWDKVMNVNLKGVFFCTQAIVTEMIKNGSGIVVNMSSESGLEGSEG